ncbi:MAG: hypothetical protein JWM08_3199 [Candidatus Angelobacter sp.]|nr:hypothetical protein [Candidatus Angelobacter sp.]
MSASNILDVLNAPPDTALLSPLWSGDVFFETSSEFVQPGDDPSMVSLRIRNDRELALQQLRLCVDEWIDAGKRKQEETASTREEPRAPEAVLAAAAYWKTSRPILDHSTNPASVKFLPPNEHNFEHALWKARRVIAVILSSDLRYRIAKCRYHRCKRPYFLLYRPDKTYVYGLFCCPSHNRATTAPKRVEQLRSKFTLKLIGWAAAYVRDHGKPGWKEDRSFKEEVARKVTRLIARERAPMRDNITRNWVTRHQFQIQARLEPTKKNSSKQCTSTNANSLGVSKAQNRKT